jgi:hypothetical protein
MRSLVRGVLLGVALFLDGAAINGAVAEELQFSGRVVVTADGNGMVHARFPTTIDGPDVTYYLVVENGMRPVRAVSITLNREVVMLKAGSFTEERREIALALVGTSDNELLVSADGERGSAAQFAIVAVPAPDDRK